MKRMKHIVIILFIAAFFAEGNEAYAQNSLLDSAYISRIKSFIKYTDFFSFIRYDQNMFEWYKKGALDHFFDKLTRVDSEKVVVLHIGDSHVQTDIGTGTVRNRLQQVFGYGGRGMVFPYKSGGTHATYDYYTESYGVWEGSRNVELHPKLNLGISGITVFTKDSAAGFSIIFRKYYYPVRENFRKVRLFCHKSPESFAISVSAGRGTQPVIVDCSQLDSVPWVEFELPKAPDTLTVMIRKQNANQKYFECYGLMLESANKGGILYNSVGINGAGFFSMTRQNLMAEQLKALSPDLVVIDIGVNDFFRGTFNYPYISSSLLKMVNLIKEACPDASVLVPNAQDIYYRGRNVTNCRDYAMLSRVLAQQNNFGLYDFYNVSGGQFSMKFWSGAGLSQRDRCHLSTKGYILRGELFANALLNSYIQYLQYKPDSLIAFRNVLDTTDFVKLITNKQSYYERTNNYVQGDKIDNYKDNPVNTTPANNSGQGEFVYYTVRSGDNLSKIAQLYKVSVEEIKAWNSLRSTNIYPGQRLKIYGRGYKPNNQTTNQGTTQAGSGTKVVYTIKQGDNLGKIAAKYGVTVQDIKKWNNLKSDNIVAGKTLIIWTGKSSGQVNNNPGNNNQSNQNNASSSTGLRKTHIVQKGESLWSIAKKYNTTVEKIKKDNNLKSDNLQPGMKLLIK